MALFAGTIFFYICVLFAALCLAVCLFLIKSRNRWSRKGIPIIEPHPLFGDMKDVVLRRKTMGENIKEFYFKTKHKPFCTFFAFVKPMVMINDLELVKNVLIKDFQCFADRHIATSAKDPLGFFNVFVAKGHFWRQLRTKLSPTFTSRKLKKMFALIDTCGRGFIDHLERESEPNGEIEIREAAARFTSDVIQSTAFGIDGDALTNKDSAFRNITKQLFSPSFFNVLKNLCSFLYPSMIELFYILNTDHTIAEFCRNTVWQTVEYREKNGVKRDDFLDLLIQLRRKGHLDDDEPDSDGENQRITNPMDARKDFRIEGDILVAQCFIFMMAGFETSSTLMSWALYEVALKPDIQQRVQDEISNVVKRHDGSITYDAIQDMVYLNMVLHETLRKYPSSVFIDRQVLSPYTLPGTNITLEKGQGVLIPAIGIHYDPELYPDPDKFDPERFSPESSQSRPSCSFLGFGEGPRICIGMRLGLLQAKVGLVYLLKNYTVSPCTKTPIPVVYDKDSFLQSPKGGMTLRLQKRT